MLISSIIHQQRWGWRETKSRELNKYLINFTRFACLFTLSLVCRPRWGGAITSWALVGGPPASAGRDVERKALCCHYHSFRSVHKLFMMTRERKEWFSGKYLLSHLHESTERFSGKERLGFKIRTHLNFIDFPTKVFEARGLLTLFLLQTRANCRTQNNFVGDDDPL